MEALKFKNYILIVILIMILTSCTQGDDKMKIIPYGTEEFKEFVKNAPISLEKAWKLQLNFYKNNPKKLNYDLYKKSSALFFIVDNNYIFTLIPFIKTKPKGELLNGIWVNSVSGEVKYNNNNQIIEAETFSGWKK